MLHLGLLGLAFVWVKTLGLWMLAVEAVLLLSWIISWRLLHRLTRPLQTSRLFADLLREQSFSSRLSPAGVQDLDALIDQYNLMLARLYEQRLQLGEQRDFVEAFLAAAPVGVVIEDFDRRVRLVNPAAMRMLEVSESAILKQKLTKVDDSLAQTLAQLSVNQKLLVAVGRRRIRAQRLTFQDRGFNRQFFVLEELTDVLNESERAAYERLIRMMSHEVSNTVASTNSLLDSCKAYIAQLEPEDQADFGQALDVVIKRSSHLNQFMQEFAALVKVPEPQCEWIDICDVFESLSIMFRQTAKHRNVHIAVDAEPSLRIWADPQLLEQALINVVKNALEASPTGGSVACIARREVSAVVVMVTDQGNGIAAALQPQLFTPFASSKRNGQGLGLALVREIMVKHQWEYQLSNRTDARGACFKIQMPAEH